MKKSSFIALVMGTVSGLLFALGMCMTLLVEWDAFSEGVVLGCLGIACGLITLGVWRKMEHKAPITVSGKHVLAIVVGVVGALLLGLGMCFVMIWEQLVVGIAVGIVGIIVLFSLIPIICGFKAG